MKEQFVDYETLKILKEIGFDENCIAYMQKINGERTDGLITLGIIDEATSADGQFPKIKIPLWQQVEQWLWEKHEMYIRAEVFFKGEKCIVGIFKINTLIGIDLTINIETNSPITAKIEGIKQAVKYLFEQNNKK